jgi:hypothetical protein
VVEGEKPPASPERLRRSAKPEPYDSLKKRAELVRAATRLLHEQGFQVSRDERNEYHGITVDRASRILDALGVQLRSILRPLPGRSKKRVEAAQV